MAQTQMALKNQFAHLENSGQILRSPTLIRDS